MFQTKDNNFENKRSTNVFFKEEVLNALPLNLRSCILGIPDGYASEVEEIRLRVNRPLTIYAKNTDHQLNEKGHITHEAKKSYIVTQSDMEKTFQLITDYSVYAFEDEIRNGFITIRGGHRVGICGRVVLNCNQVKTIKDISGLNIRISKQKIGISDRLMEYLVTPDKSFLNTLIVSPPQCGKTTLLRDIIRNLSNGINKVNSKGFKVGLVDERSEIAGCYQGIPQNDIGLRTDVLDACPKADGIMMLIRSMSPEIIATDEIGKREDINAIEEALNAGIKLITTVHGKDVHEVSRRPILNQLISQNIFDRYIIMTNQPKVGTVQEIIDTSNLKHVTIYSTLKGGKDFDS